MNEAAFDLPAGFVDRTITHLEARADDGAGVALLIERSALPSGSALRDATDKRLAASRTRLRNFSVLFERVTEVAESEAIDLGTRWRHDDGMVYTRETHMVMGGMWLIVIGEVALEDRELCDRTVDHVVASMRPRQ